RCRTVGLGRERDPATARLDHQLGAVAAGVDEAHQYSQPVAERAAERQSPAPRTGARPAHREKLRDLGGVDARPSRGPDQEGAVVFLDSHQTAAWLPGFLLYRV